MLFWYLTIGLIVGLYNISIPRSWLDLIMLFLWIFFWPIMIIIQIVILYISYFLMKQSALVLYSAGRMKTGNDLGERYKEAKKEAKFPSFIKWVIIMIKESNDD